LGEGESFFNFSGTGGTFRGEGGGGSSPPPPSLTPGEAQLIRDAISLDAHQNPKRWHVQLCPNPPCRAPLQVPALLHQRGGPIVCHRCTQKVCTRCNVKYGGGGEGIRHPQHEGITCDQFSALVRALEVAPLSPMEMRTLGVKACPFCSTLSSHFRGHGCHHIDNCRGPDGLGCSGQYCFVSLLPWEVCRDAGHKQPYPHAQGCDSRCDCVACAVCKPGRPCPQCRGDERCVGCHPPPLH